MKTIEKWWKVEQHTYSIFSKMQLVAVLCTNQVHSTGIKGKKGVYSKVSEG